MENKIKVTVWNGYRHETNDGMIRPKRRSDDDSKKSFPQRSHL